MSTASTLRTHESSLLVQVGKWFAFRFLIYVGVAVGSVGAFAAYAVFHTYVWPGVPQTQSPASDELKKPVPSSIIQKIPVPADLPRPPPDVSSLVAANGGFTFVVVNAIPSQWSVAGTLVTDARGRPFGRIIGVDIDPQSRQEQIIVRATTADKDKPILLSVGTNLVSWQENSKFSTPTLARLPYEETDLKKIIKMKLEK